MYGSGRLLRYCYPLWAHFYSCISLNCYRCHCSWLTNLLFQSSHNFSYKSLTHFFPNSHFIQPFVFFSSLLISSPFLKLFFPNQTKSSSLFKDCSSYNSLYYFFHLRWGWSNPVASPWNSDWVAYWGSFEYRPSNIQCNVYSSLISSWWTQIESWCTFA